MNARRPGGKYDGTFTADYEYVAGSGDLDECNGRFGVTPEYPQGIYYYCITEEFPQLARQWRGTRMRVSSSAVGRRWAGGRVGQVSAAVRRGNGVRERRRSASDRISTSLLGGDEGVARASSRSPSDQNNTSRRAIGDPFGGEFEVRVLKKCRCSLNA